MWRLGWAAGAGVEMPVAPHWTAKFEYLYTDYGSSSVTFRGGERFSSDFALQQVRTRPELSVRRRSAGRPDASAPAAPTRTGSISTARRPSSGRAIRQFARPTRAPTAFRPADKAAKPSTRRSVSACGCGRARNCGSTRKSIKVSASATPMASPDFRAPRPTSSARTIPTRGCSAILSRQTIDLGGESAEGRCRHQSVCRLTDRQSPGAVGRQVLESSTCSTPTNTPTIRRPIS